MKKRQRVILLSSLLLASSLALTINYAFCSPFIRDNAGSINIGITGIALGNADYYVFFGDNEKQELTKDSTTGKYTADITLNTVDSAKDYSYKITDKFGNPKYESDTFNLGITGTFNLSFGAPSDTSTTLDPSLTYSFSLVDEGNAFGASESDDDLPYCFFNETSSTRVDWWVVGQRSDTDKWWSVDAGGIRMITESDNKGYAPHVYLPAGSQFKIYNGETYKNYYGFGSLGDNAAKDNFESSGSDDNITVKSDKGGYYDIYFNSSCQIYISESTTLKQADSFDTTTNKSTFTLDATQYASSSTHLSFFNKDSSKVTEDYSLSDLGTAGSELTLKKYLYLNIGDFTDSSNQQGWYSGSPLLKAYVWKDGVTSTCYELVKYPSDSDTTNLYTLPAAIPTDYSYVNFERWRADGAEFWNKTGDIALNGNCKFTITGWTESYTASSHSGAPEFVVEKNS